MVARLTAFLHEHRLNVLKDEAPSKCRSQFRTFTLGLPAMRACCLLCSQAAVRPDPTCGQRGVPSVALTQVLFIRHAEEPDQPGVTDSGDADKQSLTVRG